MKEKARKILIFQGIRASKKGAHLIDALPNFSGANGDRDQAKRVVPRGGTHDLSRVRVVFQIPILQILRKGAVSSRVTV